MSKKDISDTLKPDKYTKIKDKIIEKFSDHALAVLRDKNEIIAVIDDSESKVAKDELQEKINSTLSGIVKNSICILTSSIVRECKDNNYSSLQKMIHATVLHDTGIVKELESMWIHKELVLKKLDKYVVAYVLAGSVVKGHANPKSDIDSYIIIDDTDVKKMSRRELSDKLRAIIIELARGVESSDALLKRRIHPQVWLLTDYWENLKESNPVTITMLRDCIPLFDRGIFMAWKNLLDMGRIKPSNEAIGMYLETGEQMYQKANAKMLEIVMEDLCLGLLYPSQALIMHAGGKPPAPKEAVSVLKDMFVKKKILSQNDIDILDKAIKMRKKIEYGEVKDIDFVQIKKMFSDGKKYLVAIKKAFTLVKKKPE